MRRLPFKFPNSRFDPWALALLHAAIAVTLYFRGMTMASRDMVCEWSFIWQSIPLEDLQWSSFWYLHAQPPGFSLWGWIWLKLFPSHFPGVLQFPNIFLGSLTSVVVYSLARRLTGSRAAAFTCGLLVALNPTMFYFEPYLLYEMIVVCIVTSSAWILERGLRLGRVRYLIAFIVVLNILVMTRSLYHLVFLATALCFAWPLWRKLRPAAAVALFAASLMLPFSWYLKNDIQYGFFGASSWFGMGVFRSVVAPYSSREIDELSKAGVVSKMCAKFWPFQHKPDQYREFNFTATSPVQFLSRDNYHNIKIIEISRGYMADSKALLRLHPERYLVSLHMAYENFCLPTSRFNHLACHRASYIWWEWIYSNVFYGMFVTDTLDTFYPNHLNSLLYFYFPVLIAGSIAWGIVWIRRNRAHSAKGDPVNPADAAKPWVMAYMVMVSLYVLVIGTMFEYGENVRFRFGIEQLNFIMFIILIRAAWLRWGPACVRWLRANPGAGRKSPAR